MTSNRPGKTVWVFSRHLSLAATLAHALARSREHDSIALTDYFACCYIADPIRFLAFWLDDLACIEGMSLDCNLSDPAWLYQHELMQQLGSELASLDPNITGMSYRYADDLARVLEKIAGSRDTGRENQEIDLPQFLLAICQDKRLSHVFSAGFREDSASRRIKDF